jgi:uncharacterized membrane protein (UPF0127 family)
MHRFESQRNSKNNYHFVPPWAAEGEASMRKVKINNLTKGNIILKEAELAESFPARLKGLLGRKSIKEDTGLIINPCNSIHMIGMKFPVDVIFVDKDQKICHMIPSMKVMHISPMVRNARYVIEAPVGTIAAKNAEVNDRVEIVK